MSVAESPQAQELVQGVASLTGLNLRTHDFPSIARLIATRSNLLHLASPEEYLKLLAEESLQAEVERQHLITELTTAETYFFRDRGQCSLLRDHILPELIACPAQAGVLRLWSVGCATGEEPYTLAILLDQLLPPSPTNWEIFILATDLNPALIDRARRGVFGNWSFRGMGRQLIADYFQKDGQGWRIDERLRAMVTFRVDNLAVGPYPKGDCHSFDLIVCRNLFIYYTPAMVSSLLAKLTSCLREGGYLMTGHAEFDMRQLTGLQVKSFPESTIYQRNSPPPSLSPPSPPSKPIRPPKPLPTKTVKPLPPSPSPRRITPGPVNPLTEAEQYFAVGDYAGVVARLEPFLRDHPDSASAHLLLAQAYANRGEHTMASSHCQRCLEGDPLQPTPYYLLAQIAREQGAIAEEKELLKKVIYLAPSHVAAYLELGMIHEQEADHRAAARLRHAALDIARQYPPEALIESCPGLKAGDICQQLQEILAIAPVNMTMPRSVVRPHSSSP